jgi:hypothetical protein
VGRRNRWPSWECKAPRRDAGWRAWTPHPH